MPVPGVANRADFASTMFHVKQYPPSVGRKVGEKVYYFTVLGMRMVRQISPSDSSR